MTIVILMLLAAGLLLVYAGVQNKTPQEVLQSWANVRS